MILIASTINISPKTQLVIITVQQYGKSCANIKSYY